MKSWFLYVILQVCACLENALVCSWYLKISTFFSRILSIKNLAPAVLLWYFQLIHSKAMSSKPPDAKGHLPT